MIVVVVVVSTPELQKENFQQKKRPKLMAKNLSVTKHSSRTKKNHENKNGSLFHTANKQTNEQTNNSKRERYSVK